MSDDLRNPDGVAFHMPKVAVLGYLGSRENER